jgi:hypothetical protein
MDQQGSFLSNPGKLPDMTPSTNALVVGRIESQRLMRYGAGNRTHRTVVSSPENHRGRPPQKRYPELIFREPIDISVGLQREAAERMAIHIGLESGSEQQERAVTLMMNLYDMFIGCDCTQLEVNPLAETPDGKVVCCDAKVNFDYNAEWRQKSILKGETIHKKMLGR